MKETVIIANLIRTPDGTILRSYSKNDFKTYIDKNGKSYSIDGGTEYLKRNSKTQDWEELSVTNQDHIEKIREYFEWGTYGKTGKEPLKYILLKDMTKEHILNIIKNVESLTPQVKEILEKELKYKIYLKMNSKKLKDNNEKIENSKFDENIEFC